MCAGATQSREDQKPCVSQPGREGEMKDRPPVQSKVMCLWEVDMVRRPCHTQDAGSRDGPHLRDDENLRAAGRHMPGGGEKLQLLVVSSPTELKTAPQSHPLCIQMELQPLHPKGDSGWMGHSSGQRTLRGVPTLKLGSWGGMPRLGYSPEERHTAALWAIPVTPRSQDGCCSALLILKESGRLGQGRHTGTS